MEKEINQLVDFFSELTNSLKNISPFILSLIISFCIFGYLLLKINFILLNIISGFAFLILAIIIVRAKLLNQPLNFFRLISLGVLGGIIIATAWQIVILQPYR